MEEIELKKRYYPIMESWRLIKEFQDATGTDEECAKVMAKIQEIYERSGKTEFSRQIMLATEDEIERIMIENRKNEKTNRP